MPFNGSGVFSIVNTFVPGTTIFSSAVNANFTDIATGLSSTVLKNGTQTITANIPMSGFGFTGVGQIASQAVITVSSATTTDILAQLSLLTAISGTATITSFGADAASRRNQIKFVRATGAFTLTHNATSLILPTGANITCADGDTFVVISDASSNTRVYAFQRKSGYAVIANPGFVNIARRNGGLEIWQRGAGGVASFAVAASGGSPYTADGWYYTNGANQASVISQQAGLSNGSQWSAKIQRNSGQTGTTQVLFGFPLDTDEIYPMLGQFIRVSFVAKAGANFSGAFMTSTLVVGTGTPVKQGLGGYTSLTVPGNLAVAITTTATRYQFSTTVVVPTTTRQAEIRFDFTPVGTAGADDSFYVDDVQLEIVPDASQGSSPFEWLNFEEQLLLCQRHFTKTFLYGTAPAQAVGNNTGEFMWSQGIAGAAAQNAATITRFPMVMRVTPAMTTYNPAGTSAQIRNESAGTDWTGTAVTINLTVSGVMISGTGAGGSIVGHTAGLHFIADAGI